MKVRPMAVFNKHLETHAASKSKKRVKGNYTRSVDDEKDN